MKRFLVTILLALAAMAADAQIMIDINQLTNHQNTVLKMMLLDAGSREPVSYASVYLTPQGDTTITYFSLSNDKGAVEIKDIIPGKYDVSAEMIGYKPYRKTHDIRGWEKDLGPIEMEVDSQFIDAAKVTAVGNAVTVDGDTLIYNASSFRVGENAMLEDLLKKMPGMEVDSDGTVKVNGEKVDKITVGGRTFFFNDPSMAVKNLPAKVVEKIKVMDKEKDEAAFTGISTKDDKEKVMDVQLKEEYKKGWFGNLKVAGGSTLGSNDSELSDNVGAVFNTNTMVAGYNETDQVTFIGGARNAAEPGSDMAYVITGEEMDDFASRRGQMLSAQAGANYNTERIKGFETSANVSYNFSRKDARERSFRTTFRPGESDLLTSGKYNGIGYDRKVSATAEIKNKDAKKSKYLVYLIPIVSFSDNSRDIAGNSSTEASGTGLNRSTSTTVSESKIFNAEGHWQLGVNDLGKERRALTFSGNIHWKNNLGSSLESSETVLGTSVDRRNLRYDNENRYFATEGVLSYVEPIGENWSMAARLTGCYISNGMQKDASDGVSGIHNDYYSSYSRNKDILIRERLLAQYKKDKTTIVFGLQLDEQKNSTQSGSFGVESTAGGDKWVLNWAPSVEMRWQKDNTDISVYTGGQSSQPPVGSIAPTLDISNPVFVSMGNVYLKPQFSQYLSGNIRLNNPKKYTFLMMGLYGSLQHNATVSASWFDKDGVRYAIPVNARKPAYRLQAYLQYRTPLNKDKTLTLSIEPYVSFNGNVSYQAKGQMPGLDRDKFDYKATMASLWGGPDGEIFYSGRSGFAESRSTNITADLSAEIEWQLDDFTLSAAASAGNMTARYSLDPSANSSVWDFDINPELLWNHNGWEVRTDMDYCFYRGYADGYGQDEAIWNARVSKSVKAFTFSFGVEDILNQTRSLRHTTLENYIEDKYVNTMGRYFMFGVTWNFGKMNARNNNKAQSAMWNMLY